ncbi:hypothetical protein [Azospirillum sp. B510]|uniref:hypothetical protein n=1 Tax=Azospirillum sp. (strain B510) TaxID=137722 RepID=UPI0011D13988|nr:hypothetical protein [Azospirillum sp. B510]
MGRAVGDFNEQEGIGTAAADHQRLSRGRRKTQTVARTIGARRFKAMGSDGERLTFIPDGHGDVAMVRETPRTTSFHSHSIVQNHHNRLKLLRNAQKALCDVRRRGRQKAMLLIPKEKLQEKYFLRLRRLSGPIEQFTIPAAAARTTDSAVESTVTGFMAQNTLRHDSPQQSRLRR